jgi:hypothetical protein
VDVVGLRDEQHGEGAVHHRAVEVERIAHGHHEARDLALDAEAVERVEDLRIRGFGAGRGERQQEGFLDEHQQLEHARAEEGETSQHQHAHSTNRPR